MSIEHLRGVDLVVELLEVADRVEDVKPGEIRGLLRQAAMVIGDLLAPEAEGASNASRKLFKPSDPAR